MYENEKANKIIEPFSLVIKHRNVTMQENIASCIFLYSRSSCANLLNVTIAKNDKKVNGISFIISFAKSIKYGENANKKVKIIAIE